MPDSVLAVDLGKTRCRAALFRGGERWDADGEGAPGLAVPNGAALAEAAILAAAAPLLRAHPVDRVGIGAAGASAAPGAARALAERLCISLPASRVAVASDAATSHLGALGGTPGVVLAVGTGAVAVAAGADGRVRLLDGLGPWLGDDGGGASLGFAGLRAALRAAEGRAPPTALSQAAEARFGPLAALPALLAGHPHPPALAARFAPDVAECAAAGDLVATALLHDAAASLAATVRAAVAGGAPHLAVPRLAVVGGLATLLSGPVLDRLRGVVRPVPAAGTSLDGARRLASDAATLHEPGVVRARADPDGNRLDQLATEAARPGLDDLDRWTPGAVVRLVLEAEWDARHALARAAPALAAAADAVGARMRGGGRLFILGAGTPGRLAALDAAELLPTFSAPPGLVVALLAGGPAATLHAVEGAEDDADAAGVALDARTLRPADSVVGITASGRTPFVLGGLRHARAAGALTVAVVNNAGSPCAAAAELAVEILTGPEIVAGSTRMLAGTAQKVALGALSTAVMIGLGKTYGPHMVDVAATNAKLRRRALRIVRDVTAAGEAEAAAALAACGGRVKPALVALLAGVDPAEAARRLEAAGGRVRAAIGKDG